MQLSWEILSFQEYQRGGAPIRGRASSDIKDSWFSACDVPAVSSDWIVTEFASALSIKERSGTLTAKDAKAVWRTARIALRYEGLNLEVLALLFTKTGRSEIEANLAEKPESSFARRIGFLYEWLTDEKLNAVVVPRAAYVRVVDETLQSSTLLSASQNHCKHVRRTIPTYRKVLQQEMMRITFSTSMQQIRLLFCTERLNGR